MILSIGEMIIYISSNLVQFCVSIRSLFQSVKTSLYFTEERMNEWFDCKKMSLSQSFKSISRENIKGSKTRLFRVRNVAFSQSECMRFK